jgi:hypothetical protein
MNHGRSFAKDILLKNHSKSVFAPDTSNSMVFIIPFLSYLAAGKWSGQGYISLAVLDML